jgi:dihydrofolate reductase
MPRVIYSMGVSLDGYIAGPDCDFDWAAPDEELHRFHNEQTRELAVHFCGRRLYETMVPWERPEASAAGEVAREFATIWQALPKIVFSTTLTEVEGNATLARGTIADEVARWKAAAGGDLAVGGAGLAAAFIAEDLVDEYRLFVNPVIVGGGTPFFPATAQRLDLELVETRRFGSRVVYTRYVRVR